MNTLDTINVIESVGEAICQLKSFPNTPEGNKEAESFFSDLFMQNGGQEEELGDYLDEGRFDNDNYILRLVHSA